MGNLRVAIFNYLFARRHGGAFVVRIEDTDLERNISGGVERILQDLSWAGLDWDEGPDRGGRFGPYLQSERADSHRERAQALAAAGKAYLCFCEEVEAQSDRTVVREGPGCVGGCRDLSPHEAETRRREGEPAALRFAIPADIVQVHDAVRGEITFPGKDVGDFVILRADGRATYNFAVAVDDIEMEITHVIRGSGHLSNTPKQALIFDALGVRRPVFAHLPTVLGPDGTKLSKRTGAPGVSLLRDEGYHPEGVANYLSLLGWSPGDDRELLSREELIASMELERVGASDTMYDPEKLLWMSGQHIARMSLDDLADAVAPFIDTERFPLTAETLPPALEAIRSRLHTFAEANDHLTLVFADPEALEAGYTELRDLTDARMLLATLRDRLVALDQWDAEETGGAVREVGTSLHRKGSALFHPVRLALTGARSGPDLGMLLAAMGRSHSVELLDRAVGRLD